MVAIIKDKNRGQVMVLKNSERKLINLQYCFVCKREVISEFYVCEKYKRVFCVDCEPIFKCENPRILPVFANSEKSIKNMGYDMDHIHDKIDLIQKEWEIKS